MQPHWKPLSDWFASARKHAQDRIDAIGRRMQIPIDDYIAAPDRVPGDIRAGQIERAPIACATGLSRPVLGMQ
jgi:hypothetical protein